MQVSTGNPLYRSPCHSQLSRHHQSQSWGAPWLWWWRWWTGLCCCRPQPCTAYIPLPSTPPRGWSCRKSEINVVSATFPASIAKTDTASNDRNQIVFKRRHHGRKTHLLLTSSIHWMTSTLFHLSSYLMSPPILWPYRLFVTPADLLWGSNKCQQIPRKTQKQHSVGFLAPRPDCVICKKTTTKKKVFMAEQ